MQTKLSEIHKQILNNNPKISKQDQLQSLLNQLNETKYQIKKEINTTVKTLGTNLQTLLTEKLLQIINKLSDDLIPQIQNSWSKLKSIEKISNKVSPLQKVQKLNNDKDSQQK